MRDAGITSTEPNSYSSRQSLKPIKQTHKVMLLPKHSAMISTSTWGEKKLASVSLANNFMYLRAKACESKMVFLGVLCCYVQSFHSGCLHSITGVSGIKFRSAPTPAPHKRACWRQQLMAHVLRAAPPMGAEAARSSHSATAGRHRRK